MASEVKSKVVSYVGACRRRLPFDVIVVDSADPSQVKRQIGLC